MNANTAPGDPAIKLHRVGVSRGGRWILRDVDWTVAPHTCAAILGPNGSGKSTLARVISGYLWPSSGEVSVDGHRFGDVDINELRKSIRLVQPAGPYDVDGELTVREVVLTGAFGTIGLFNEPTSEDMHRADQLIDQVGLSQVRHRPYATLSSGERVRSLIARALMHRPKLLILDEPTAGLDLLAREQVLATVQSLLNDPRHAPTVLMITHHVEELPPVTANVLLLGQGAVAARGAPGEVLRTEVLSRVYRCPLNVINRSGRYYVQVDPSAWNALLG
jgi:iron complex transport system ATP-binding protein